jgi:hypothetical protein
MKRVRKAVAGALGAGVAAVISGFTFTGAPTKDQVGQLIGTFVAGAFVGFVTVWSAPPNAPQPVAPDTFR